MRLWKPKEVAGGRRTAHSSQCPPEVAGEDWRGASVFLLVKRMVLAACSGIIGNGRIWTSALGPKEPPVSGELTIVRLEGTEECSGPKACGLGVGCPSRDIAWRGTAERKVSGSSCVETRLPRPNPTSTTCSMTRRNVPSFLGSQIPI